jgi:hypothetical protein
MKKKERGPVGEAGLDAVPGAMPATTLGPRHNTRESEAFQTLEAWQIHIYLRLPFQIQTGGYTSWRLMMSRGGM